MGVVADYVSVPEDAWPAALSRVRAAGIEVHDEGMERGVRWYSCTRGACRIGLGYYLADGRWVAVVYCPWPRFWRHPIGIPRLYRDVRRAVRSGAEVEVSPSGGP